MTYRFCCFFCAQDFEENDYMAMPYDSHYTFLNLKYKEEAMEIFRLIFQINLLSNRYVSLRSKLNSSRTIEI